MLLLPDIQCHERVQNILIIVTTHYLFKLLLRSLKVIRLANFYFF